MRQWRPILTRGQAAAQVSACHFGPGPDSVGVGGLQRGGDEVLVLNLSMDGGHPQVERLEEGLSDYGALVTLGDLCRARRTAAFVLRAGVVPRVPGRGHDWRVRSAGPGRRGRVRGP
jgi:hypothetical protein